MRPFLSRSHPRVRSAARRGVLLGMCDVTNPNGYARSFLGDERLQGVECVLNRFNQVAESLREDQDWYLTNTRLGDLDRYLRGASDFHVHLRIRGPESAGEWLQLCGQLSTSRQDPLTGTISETFRAGRIDKAVALAEGEMKPRVQDCGFDLDELTMLVGVVEFADEAERVLRPGLVVRLQPLEDCSHVLGHLEHHPDERGPRPVIVPCRRVFPEFWIGLLITNGEPPLRFPAQFDGEMVERRSQVVHTVPDNEGDVWRWLLDRAYPDHPVGGRRPLIVVLISEGGVRLAVPPHADGLVQIVKVLSCPADFETP